MSEDRPAPADEVRRLYEEAEDRTAKAWEGVVQRDAFGELLARVTENVVAVTRIGNDVADLVLRNLRIAGRRDLAALGRQLARTEDKLEMVLQEIERLQAQLAAQTNGAAPRGPTGTTRASSQDGAEEPQVREPQSS